MTLETDGTSWCEPDGCPAIICMGPHVSHDCVDGSTVTRHVDNVDPCPFCGKVDAR